ncbi:protein of unknown function [Streptomyces sp. KY75]|nr:protein of unknown function [Streptomyces sp. KY70]CAD5991656.1 protein of unknown function [Streptomyces sp. KY75]
MVLPCVPVTVGPEAVRPDEYAYSNPSAPPPVIGMDLTIELRYSPGRRI